MDHGTLCRTAADLPGIDLALRASIRALSRADFGTPAARAGPRVSGDNRCAPANNTPVPLERSPPVSFKRLLGRGPLCSFARLDSTDEFTGSARWRGRAEGLTVPLGIWPPPIQLRLSGAC